MKVVVLTGAGISAESGLKTFRDNNGLWENHRIEEVATPSAFSNHPELVHKFYNLRRAQLLSGEVNPNPAHLALVELEKKLGDDFLLVTQNVDDLHERAGSERLLHMHGELLKVRCIGSGEIFEWKKDLECEMSCQCCQKVGLLRPHIVWFGEMPLFMHKIYAALENCDYFISIGTSGNVYPAAGFVEVAKVNSKAKTLEINLEPSQGAHHFDVKVHGKAGEEVPRFIKELLKEI